MDCFSRIAMVAAVALFTDFGCGARSDIVGTAPPRSEQAGASDALSGRDTTNVLVGYYSLSGNTEEMAAAVVDGANQVDGVVVTRKPVAEITQADLEAAEGLVLGCPTHFANIPGEMKTTIDHWAWKLRINLMDKVGGAFSTGGNLTGGKEHVVVSLLLYMLNNRMVVVGPIYREGDRGWGEIGASAATGADDRGLSEVELADARRLGKRVATVARRMAAR